MTTLLVILSTIVVLAMDNFS